MQSKIKQLEKENNEEVSNLKENLSSLKAKVPNLSDHNWFKTEILNNLSLMNPKKAFYISNSMIALLSNWQTKIEIKMKQKVNGTD